MMLEEAEMISSNLEEVALLLFWSSGIKFLPKSKTSFPQAVVKGSVSPNYKICKLPLAAKSNQLPASDSLHPIRKSFTSCTKSPILVFTESIISGFGFGSGVHSTTFGMASKCKTCAKSMINRDMEVWVWVEFQ